MLLGDPGFLKKLAQYDKDHILKSKINAIEPIIMKDDFDIEMLTKKNRAIGNLAEWVHGIYLYYQWNHVHKIKEINWESKQIKES